MNKVYTLEGETEEICQIAKYGNHIPPEEIVDELNGLHEENEFLNSIIQMQSKKRSFSEEVIGQLDTIVQNEGSDFLINFFTQLNNHEFLTIDMSKGIIGYGDDFITFISKAGNGLSIIHLDQLASVEIVPKK